MVSLNQIARDFSDIAGHVAARGRIDQGASQVGLADDKIRGLNFDRILEHFRMEKSMLLNHAYAAKRLLPVVHKDLLKAAAKCLESEFNRAGVPVIGVLSGDSISFLESKSSRDLALAFFTQVTIQRSVFSLQFSPNVIGSVYDSEYALKQGGRFSFKLGPDSREFSGEVLAKINKLITEFESEFTSRTKVIPFIDYSPRARVPVLQAEPTLLNGFRIESLNGGGHMVTVDPAVARAAGVANSLRALKFKASDWLHVITESESGWASESERQFVVDLSREMGRFVNVTYLSRAEAAQEIKQFAVPALARTSFPPSEIVFDGDSGQMHDVTGDHNIKLIA